MDIKLMIKELLSVNNLNWEIPIDEARQIEMLDALRTVCRPAELSDEYYKNEKNYIESNRDYDEIVDVESIEERLIDNIYIYLGDITKIKADAIVNAANEKLLGCFIPGHNCIDNAIHMEAGLKLRNECNEMMTKQGCDEPAGGAKITKGYNLPSEYVIHTVGPNVHALKTKYDGEKLTEVVKEQLSGCYNSILNAANKHRDIDNVFICSISTGVYGVPIEFASMIAIETIMKNKNNLEKIIINVFSKEDYDEYKRQAEQIRTGNN